MTEEVTMNAALKKKCEVIARLRDQVRSLTLEARHEVGLLRYNIGTQVVLVMDDEKKYGTCGVPTLARALKMSAANLYYYARVARCWTKAEVDTLLRTNTFLSFSHLIECSLETRAAKRNKLLQDAVAARWSVRFLGQKRTGEVLTFPLRSPSVAARDAGVAEVVAWLRAKDNNKHEGKTLHALASIIEQQFLKAADSAA